MGDTGLPRNDLNCADVRKGEHVGQSSLESALDINDVAHRCRRVDGPAEGHAVFDRASEPVDQNVTSSIGADQVRVADANNVDLLRHELGSSLLQAGRVEMSHPNLRTIGLKLLRLAAYSATEQSFGPEQYRVAAMLTSEPEQ